MPLYVISGVTSLNTTFYVAFYFIKGEYTADYLQVIQQLKKLYNDLDLPYPDVILTDCEAVLIRSINQLFPKAVNVTYIWYVNNNVTTNYSKYFDKDETQDTFQDHWKRCMYAKTEEIFDSELVALQEAYNTVASIAVTYLIEKLVSRKRKFVAYWVDQHLHFGNRTISRGENTNSKIKKQLGTSTGNKILLDILPAY